MGYILSTAVYWFSQIIILALVVRALLSWFAQNPYSSLGKAYTIAVKFTEPFVAPCRKLLSNFKTGMFDFSVLLAFFLVEIIARILIYIIALIF